MVARKCIWASGRHSCVVWENLEMVRVVARERVSSLERWHRARKWFRSVSLFAPAYRLSVTVQTLPQGPRLTTRRGHG